ncbi:MAG: hypothetical protein HYW48_06660 [Deltaproteobacteria bacterium]|nr:hypothetical protein [Deltaproteobacteria bacterium]
MREWNEKKQRHCEKGEARRSIQVVCRLQGGKISAWIASHSLAMTEILLTFSHMNRPCSKTNRSWMLAFFMSPAVTILKKGIFTPLTPIGTLIQVAKNMILKRVHSVIAIPARANPLS